MASLPRPALTARPAGTTGGPMTILVKKSNRLQAMEPTTLINVGPVGAATACSTGGAANVAVTVGFAVSRTLFAAATRPPASAAISASRATDVGSDGSAS